MLRQGRLPPPPPPNRGEITSKRGCYQAQARTSYTPPLFGGHLRSIPHGMIFDALVKSLFCPIRRSPTATPPRSGHRNCRNVPERFAGTL